ncbi:MAG TPA: SH3 domain-containing protein [Candidatus Udaeobacter sp.]
MATATPPRAAYQVIGIPQGDYLNVREGAGSDYQVVTKLEPGTGGILLGTKRIVAGATTWQEIIVDGHTGWVNAAYIALETQVPTSPTPSPAESSTPP